MLSKFRCAVAIVATLAAASSASAEPASSNIPAADAFGVSALALPAVDLAQNLVPSVEAVGFAPAPPSGTRLDATRYRPRRGGYGRRPSYERRSSRSGYGSPVQIHAGFFELDESDTPSSFVIGMRGGPATDPHIQLAFGVDWMHNGERSRTVTGEPYQQGGVTIVPERELARASSDLLPLTANLQVNLSKGGPVIPYVGIGGGYQVLWLSAEDFNTGEAYDATFGGWMWQLFGGVQLPLSGNSRLLGEVFLHDGEADREVEDPSGQLYREIVDLDGTGMRFGLSWGF